MGWTGTCPCCVGLRPIELSLPGEQTRKYRLRAPDRNRGVFGRVPQRPTMWPADEIVGKSVFRQENGGMLLQRSCPAYVNFALVSRLRFRLEGAARARRRITSVLQRAASVDKLDLAGASIRRISDEASMTPDRSLDFYFERTGWGGTTAPSLATLSGLLTAHMRTIPFENLDVLAGRPIRLDIEFLARKAHRRASRRATTRRTPRCLPPRKARGSDRRRARPRGDRAGRAGAAPRAKPRDRPSA